MPEPRPEFMFRFELDLAPAIEIGDVPIGHRIIGPIAGGSFEGPGLSDGPALKGEVVPGGGDWLFARADGVLDLDVRTTLRTDDGALIYMIYRGLRHGPADVMAKLNAGQPVDPSLIYFRTTPYFETAKDGPYAWLNKSCFVSLGRREPTGPIYQVFEVL